jgi:hypothetical protein
VDDVDGRISCERLEAAVGIGHAQLVGSPPRQRLVGVGHGDDVDEPEPPHGVHVVGADEPRPHEPHPDAGH